MKLLKRLAFINQTGIGATPTFEDSEHTLLDTTLAFLIGKLESVFLTLKKEKSQYQQLHRSGLTSKLQNQKSKKAANYYNNNRNWAPIIKAKSSIKSNDTNGCTNTNQLSLFEKSVLCVGGQLKLYPQYGQLVEALGGQFMAFHNNANDTSFKHLLQLLQKADMIICPVDCVDHEAFLLVKKYCESFDKLCVLLDRSSIATFQQGIHALTCMATETEVFS